MIQKERSVKGGNMIMLIFESPGERDGYVNKLPMKFDKKKLKYADYINEVGKHNRVLSYLSS